MVHYFERSTNHFVIQNAPRRYIYPCTIICHYDDSTTECNIGTKTDITADSQVIQFFYGWYGGKPCQIR